MTTLDTTPRSVEDVFPHRQHNRQATSSGLRFWARSIGEMNPRFVDAAYDSPLCGPAFTAHPCWLSSVHHTVEPIGPAGTYPVLGGTHWTFERPVVTGERVVTVARLIEEATKETELAGPTLVHTVQFDYLGDRGDLIASAASVLFHVDPERARALGKHADWARKRYTDQQFTDIEHAYDHEEIRGATPRYVDDTLVGERLPRIVRGPLTSEEIVLFVGATRPIPSGELFSELYAKGEVTGFTHPLTGLLESTAASLLDDLSATHLGFPAAHDMGPDRIAQCATLVTNWMGDVGVLQELDVRLEEPHMLGDTSWFEGTIVDLSHLTDHTGVVAIDIRVTNQHREPTASGRAVVRLPRRGARRSGGARL